MTAHDTHNETVHLVTISMTGTVSYDGEDGHGYRFSATTYYRAEEFPWKDLPKLAPVLDLRGADWDTVWDVCINPRYATASDKLRACTDAGLPVCSVQRFAARIAAEKVQGA